MAIAQLNGENIWCPNSIHCQLDRQFTIISMQLYLCLEIVRYGLTVSYCSGTAAEMPVKFQNLMRNDYT